MSSVARPGQLRHLGDAGLLGLAVVCALLLGCGANEAADPTGHALYLRHCASCHGASGKGDGPVAGSLQQRPADLTTIAKRAAGRFDEARVMRSIDGRRAVAAHGPREMPVWGAVFSEEHKDQPRTGYTVLLHARALTDYLRSIQEE